MEKYSQRTFVADFETTVYDNQEETEVWGGSIVELDSALESKDVVLFRSMAEFMDILEELSDQTPIHVLFHNLKFDGSFIIDYLLRHSRKYEPAMIGDSFIEDKYMRRGQFKYLIDGMGTWYTITIKGKNFIRIMDSLKLLPFSVKQIGKAFNTKVQKTEIEYEGERHAGYVPTCEEAEYMKNDVLVVAEALRTLRDEGHKSNTIGGCCLKEYKKILRDDYRMQFRKYFPNLTEHEIDKETYGYETAEEYIRRSYRGGWCYLKRGKEDKVYTGSGCTADVNSLYPSVMHSESGNIYPVGEPTFWVGNEIPEEALKPMMYYFLTIEGEFNLKDGYLPFIQIKHSPFYDGNEMLETSDITVDGEVYSNKVKMVVTCTDWELINKHYNHNFQILSGCWFHASRGMFDMYINKYSKIKQESKGAKRTLAKLFLNNLYGQMAKSPESDYKVARLVDGQVKFHTVFAKNLQRATYIPIGSAITSYARKFTITAAQENYDNFVYADTDSIHCTCKPDELKGIKVHDTAFNCWKIENEWNGAIFHRQKTYIEHDDNEWIIKCAGMPDSSKKIFLDGINNGTYTLNDFRAGLEVKGKLLPKRIKGGIILKETTYVLRD